MVDRFFVILAGGSGERLWPLSDSAMPKQLLKVGCDKTLLDQTIDRLLLLGSKDSIMVSTTAEHKDKIEAAVGHRVHKIIVEPVARNTGPAVLATCLSLYSDHKDAVVTFVSADAFIPNPQRYTYFLEHALDYVCKEDKITLLGVRPTYPATGYGYIKYDNAGGLAPYCVEQFYEKPSFERACEYVQASFLWNIGVFSGKIAVFIQEFERHAPEIFHQTKAYFQGDGLYVDIPSLSVDYAVIEKSSVITVLPVDFVWCDVGTVETFVALQKQYQGTTTEVISIDAQNNSVDAPCMTVALIGVDDLCVVKNGNSLLIVKKDCMQDVRKVAQYLVHK